MSENPNNKAAALILAAARSLELAAAALILEEPATPAPCTHPPADREAIAATFGRPVSYRCRKCGADLPEPEQGSAEE